jgi:hypothetical protein
MLADTWCLNVKSHRPKISSSSPDAAWVFSEEQGCPVLLALTLRARAVVSAFTPEATKHSGDAKLQAWLLRRVIN